MFAGVQAGELAIALAKDVRPAYVAQGAVITGITSNQQLVLGLRNVSSKTLKVVFPRYITATDPNRKKGFSNTTDYGPYLIIIPPDYELVLESGQASEKRIALAYSIGNDADNIDNRGYLTEPWGARKFEIQSLPADSPWIKLADAIASTKPPLGVGLAQTIITIAASQFDEDRVKSLRGIRSFIEVPQIEAVFRAGNLDPAQIPLLIEARRSYRERTTRIHEALKIDDANFSVVMQDFFQDARLFKGDINFARFLAQHLGMAKTQVRATHLILALEKMEAVDETILAALDTQSKANPDPMVREQAAAAIEKLRSIRKP